MCYDNFKKNFLQVKPETKEIFKSLEKAVSLQDIIISTLILIKSMAIWIVEEIIRLRANVTTDWPLCPKCGQRLESKGFQSRQILTLFGSVHWKRRVGRCPNGCKIGLIAPLDASLKIAPYQMTCNTIKRIACLLAVFLPFEIVVFLLQQCLGLKISSDAVWNWVQKFGSEAMYKIEEELRQLREGNSPSPEKLSDEINMLPLLVGGDGV
ncbi:MAG: ISKra4 family transposase, partial [Desulfobacterales bacterium]|nr:ISKra4 family transposase [Desulfobacterales bacterium]